MIDLSKERIIPVVWEITGRCFLKALSKAVGNGSENTATLRYDFSIEPRYSIAECDVIIQGTGSKLPKGLAKIWYTPVTSITVEQQTQTEWDVVYLQLTYFQYAPPQMIREWEEYRLKNGELTVRGIVLEDKPATFVSFDKAVQSLRETKPDVVDYTMGKGTWYEQAANVRTHDD